MKLFPSQFPISRALITYSIVIAMILVVVIAGSINFQVGSAIKDLQERTTREDAEDVSKAIKTFLSYKKEALKEFAQRPLITQSVMQPGEMRPQLIDAMQGMTLIGTECQLNLLDFEGRSINSSRPLPVFDYTGEHWVQKLIGGKIAYHWEISSTTTILPRRYWRIAIPVLFGGQPEGILVAEIDLTGLNTFHSHLPTAENIEIEIIQHGESVATFGPRIDTPAYTHVMADPHLLILCRMDDTALNRTRMSIVVKVSLALMATAFVFLCISLYFANRLYANPLKNLRQMVLKMYNDPTDNVLPTDQRLLEISALAEEYNWLTRQIQSREKALLDAKENLEVTVEARTRELQESQEQLRILNEGLEEQISDRTIELETAQDRLVMQEKMASVGQLAAGLSHELNNPINFVRTNFATLVEDFDDLLLIHSKYEILTQKAAENPLLAEPAAEVQMLHKKLGIEHLLEDIPQLFDESERGFVRIAQIIQSMRDFSRIDFSGEFSWANINSGIEDTLIIARNEYKYHADVHTELGDVADIHCSLEQLSQVFLNLIVNSAHAIASQDRTDKGLISIRTWQEGNTILCEFRDDGPGVPIEQRHQIFEPFYTTKAPGKGTGLGLSISYDIIVNKHRGELSLHCPDEGGSIFTISLPVDQKEEVTHDSH
ncbi:sensor histidine kinase [Desulfosediminicola sp.]|uniref:sensor histidine kinase n=1 Tax=Desulfosediminicola sp. TaxID=2886825 RepID=UPI003AF2BBC8